MLHATQGYVGKHYPLNQESLESVDIDSGGNGSPDLINNRRHQGIRSYCWWRDFNRAILTKIMMVSKVYYIGIRGGGSIGEESVVVSFSLIPTELTDPVGAFNTGNSSLQAIINRL